MKNIDIIKEGQKEGKTLEQINEDLKAAGYTPYFGPKTGNAWLDSVWGDEPCTVEGGKLISGGASPHSDVVIYGGEEYHVDDDGITLIRKPAPEAPWWFDEDYKAWGMEDRHDELDKYIPDKGMMHRPEYANKTVRKGDIRYHYDSDGNADWEPVSMAEYDADHGRNQ